MNVVCVVFPAAAAVTGTRIAAAIAAAPAAHTQRDWYQCCSGSGASNSRTAEVTCARSGVTVTVRRSRSRPSTPTSRTTPSAPESSTARNARAPAVRAWINMSSAVGGAIGALRATTVVSAPSSTRVPHGAYAVQVTATQ